MARMVPAAAKPLDARVRILILVGPELMLQRQAMDELRAGLQAEHGAVEPVIFDGAMAGLAEVFDELRTQSLLSGYRLVVVDSAAEFASNHRAALERYAQQPVSDATLVLRSPVWHPGNLDKLVREVGAVRRCDALKAYEAAKWVRGRAEEGHRCQVSERAAGALVERAGTDLMRLDAELGKLAALAGDGVIDERMIDELVGRGSDEQAWVAQEAILAGMAQGAGAGRAMGAAIEKAHELVEVAGQPGVLVLYFVADLFRKLYKAAGMKARGATAGDIGRALRLWGGRQELYWQALNRIRPGSAGRLFDRVVQADRRSKSSLGDPLENLEVFLATVADELV